MTTNLNAHDCFTRANELFSRGHYLDAQTLYDRACDLDPTNAEYHKGQGRLHELTFRFLKNKKVKQIASDTALAAFDCCDCCSDCCLICSC